MYLGGYDMYINENQIVGSTILIKNPTKVWERLNEEGLLCVFKNNKPCAIMLTIEEYDKLINLTSKKID
jgi:hypothetical protein